ncbi:MAG: PEGA domain-containing protein [Pyrinomonadaceae bacterium]
MREVRTETKIVKTSNLTVSSEAGAKVVLESSISGVKPMTKEISKNNSRDKTVEFENLRPGKYTVTASLDGYKTQETEVTIAPQKTVGISLDLESYKYQLNIDTNVTDGEVRFAPARLEGTNSDGSLKTIETGGYCIVLIKKGKAVINELQKGYYNIDIRPSAVEYQPVLTAINVPTEILDKNDTESNEQQSYRIELDKKISTETFASAWINDEWDLQQGWKLQDRKMKTAGLAGIALPRNEQYRYYTKFEMTSDVIMTDGNSIGFALRAVDRQNYYLVRISGAKASEPFLATGFVIKNNKATLLFSIPIDHFAKTIQAKKSFRVIIKGEENKDNNTFKIFLEDSETGESHEVGNMIDRDKNFRKGAVGIVGRENANSEVGTFTVCATSCH